MMETRKTRHRATNFQDRFYGDHTYRKEERREGKTEIRRRDSSHHKREVVRTRDKSESKGGTVRKSEYVRKSSEESVSKENRSIGKHPSEQRSWMTNASGKYPDNKGGQRSKGAPDRRRWGWAGTEFDYPRKNTPDIDYVDISSIESSSSSSSEDEDNYRNTRATNPPGYPYNKLYTPNHRAVTRSRSVNHPPPQRSKSLGPSSRPHTVYANRTQSFTSLHDTRHGYSHTGGTALDLRPLRTSVSSQGIYFTETGHVPRNPHYDHQGGPLSMSLQDVQLTRKVSRQKTGASLLDLSNVTINDSEIDRVGHKLLYLYDIILLLWVL